MRFLKREMVPEFSSIILETSTLVSGRTIFSIKEFISLKMDRASKALFEKENKDLAPIFTPMGTYILVIGKTISNKVKEL